MSSYNFVWARGTASPSDHYRSLEDAVKIDRVLMLSIFDSIDAIGNAVTRFEANFEEAETALRDAVVERDTHAVAASSGDAD